MGGSARAPHPSPWPASHPSPGLPGGAPPLWPVQRCAAVGDHPLRAFWGHVKASVTAITSAKARQPEIGGAPTTVAHPARACAAKSGIPICRCSACTGPNRPFPGQARLSRAIFREGDAYMCKGRPRHERPLCIWRT